MDAFGWALRLYGSHNDKTFTDLRHDGETNPYFDSW